MQQEGQENTHPQEWYGSKISKSVTGSQPRATSLDWNRPESSKRDSFRKTKLL